MNNFTLNAWGHFQDPETELQYVRANWIRNLFRNRVVCLVAGLGYFSIIVVDLKDIHDAFILNIVIAIRVVVLLVGLALFLYSPKQYNKLQLRALFFYSILYPVSLVAIIYVENPDLQINVVDMLTFPMVLLALYFFPALPARHMLFSTLTATALYCAVLLFRFITPFDVLFPAFVILLTINILGIYHTITSRINHRMRFELNELLGMEIKKQNASQTQLKILLDEKNDLMGLLSHDMRSPLNQMKALAELMQLTLDDKPGLQKSLLLLKDIANSQLVLYSNILQMLKADDLTLRPTRVQRTNLAELAMTIKNDYKVDLIAKKIELNFSVPDNLFVTVQRDSFMQAFKNVVQNAIKFSYEGGNISVDVKEDSGYIVISVSDTGMGFDESLASHLFDRFTKASRKGTNNEPSSGFGMYLTRKIIEAHQGTIVAESKGYKAGATFTIKLPQRATDSNQLLLA